jgi:hypothetical protein
MNDYNLFNRASFSDTTIRLKSLIKPGQTSNLVRMLQPGSILAAKQVTWKYSVENGQLEWPKTPLLLSIADVEGRAESPIFFSPPVLFKDKLEAKVINPSTIGVYIHLELQGTLVTPKPGAPGLSDTEVLGYSLLDKSQIGMLALSEAAVDRLHQGLPGSFQSSLPGSNLKALSTSDQPALSAPEKSQEELESLLIGDLVTAKAGLTLEEIQPLATYLLSKGWRR